MPSIEYDDIDRDEVSRLLSIEEGHFFDVKAIEIAPSKLTKTLSAFSNAAGGELYIGIAEVGEPSVRHWRGFANPEAANGHLQAIEQFFPLGAEVSASFLRHAGAAGLVLKIEVQKSRAIRYASDGKIYIRRGAQSLPVKGDDEKRRLELDKGVATFEDELVSATPSIVTESKELVTFLRNLVPRGAAPEAWLQKQSLLHDGRLTVAAVLLFAEEPQASLPKRSAIKVYRYKTNDPEGSRATLTSDPETIEGCVYQLIRQSVARTKQIIEGISVLGGPAGLQQVAYPEETLHEIITNAVLHRDYNIQADTQIRIFDNRVEVESPGKLPGHITVKNILAEQYARNPRVVRLINKFPDPPNKDVGEGLNTAFAAMRELRLREPEITENDHSVTVYIRHESLASIEDTIVSYVSENGTINNTIARRIAGVSSDSVVRKAFGRLRSQGLLERVPEKEGRAAAWRLTAKGQSAAADYKKRRPAESTID